MKDEMKCCVLTFALVDRWNFVVLVGVVKIDNEIDILQCKNCTCVVNTYSIHRKKQSIEWFG